MSVVLDINFTGPPPPMHIEVRNGFLSDVGYLRFYRSGLLFVRRLFLFTRKIGVSGRRRVASRTPD